MALLQAHNISMSVGVIAPIRQTQDAQDTNVDIKPDMAETGWCEGGHWEVMDKSSLEKFYHAIINSSRRPKCITISGCDWNEPDLLKLLTRLSIVHCEVHLKLDDAFEQSVTTTSNWTRILLNTEAK